MKKLLLLLTLFLVSGLILFAQAPQAFKYQAIARDINGNILTNSPIGIRITILKEGVDGTAAYVETQQVKSNPYGIINLVIGKGQVEKGNFTEINWGEDACFIKIEIDITGGTDYKGVGTSQLYAVPYALYAEQAGNIVTQKTGIPLVAKRSPVQTTNTQGRFSGTPNCKISAAGNSYLNAFVGNVGIGTTFPGGQLHIVGTPVNAYIIISVNQSSGGGDAMLYFAEDKSNYNSMYLKYEGDSDKLLIAGRTGTVHYGPHMSINRFDGNIGIATTTPSQKLDVNGNIKADYLYGNGSGLTNLPGDDLGNHTATQNILLNGNWLSGDGGNEGVFVDNSGNVGIGLTNPQNSVHISGNALVGTTSKGIQFKTDGTFVDVLSVGTDLAINYMGNNTLLNIVGGNVGIGSVNPSEKLAVKGDATKQDGGTSWKVWSDERLKTNINTIPDALGKINKLHGVTFEWKDQEEFQPGIHMGMIAQEVEGVIPEWISTGPNGYKMFQPEGFEALIVEAIKMLLEENNRLRHDIEELRLLVDKNAK
ncbi:MAG: tail fiber domain-containing protein [Bacteroidales bacterium]|nr:tail fiber domain-containing protein [Bacteroidales bacterium]